MNGPSFEEYSKGARSLIVKFAQASCGPCLAELRDLEKRRAQLPNDVRVAVVSVDDHPNDTAAVLREHGYEGIVFDGRRLARENGVRDYPTTWFLDARHELVFEKSGRSRELVEEYNWRVEAMAKP